MASGAPLTIISSPSLGSRRICDIRLRSESNGFSKSSASSGHRFPTAAFEATTFNAISVGSPTTSIRWSAGSQRHCELLHWSAYESMRRSGPGSSLESSNSALFGPSRGRISPSGPKPSPSTTQDWSGIQSCRTVISLRVSVPVLSLQITVTQPRVSTLGSLRMIAFRFAMRCKPIARVTVTTAGSPSGMAATAKLTLVKKTSANLPPRSHSRTKMIPTIARQQSTRTCPSCANRFCNGVGSC